MAEINGMHNLHTITTKENYNAPVGEERSTCRRGTKWMDLELDTEIVLTIGESEFERDIIGRGIVTSKEYMLFEDLSERHYKSNHSKYSQQGLLQLFERMQQFYGKDFNWSTPVTVLYYKRIL